MDTPNSVTEDTFRKIVREELNAHSGDRPSATPESRPYLTTEDVTRRLSISKTTLWQLRRDGKIPAYSVGRRVLFRADDVTALVERNGAEPNLQST